MISHKLGKDGESIATKYLKVKGYQIVERNFSCKQGEIDIIAINNEYLIFVEVKTRSSLYFGNPSEAVNFKKQQHMYLTAKYYLKINNLQNTFIRFDVVEVYSHNGKFDIRHIKQIM